MDNRDVARAPGLRVLLVEDHPIVSEVTAELLRGEGLDVQTARSGCEALSAAAVFPARLVLCDLHLPDMSGLDVIQSLRSNPLTADACAVILTAIRIEEMPRTLVDELRIDAFVLKPLTVEAVRVLVNKTRAVIRATSA